MVALVMKKRRKTNRTTTDQMPLAVRRDFEAWTASRDRGEPDLAVRNRLVEYCLPRLRNTVLAKRASCPKAEVDDLLGAAVMGLMDALNRVRADVAQGSFTKFWTYAYRRVQGEMLDDQRRYRPVSRTLLAQQRQIEDAAARLLADGQRATPVELAAALGWSEERVFRVLNEALRAYAVPCHFQEMRGEESSDLGPLERAMLYALGVPDSVASIAVKREFWQEAVRGLFPREAQCVLLYYRDGLTMRQVGVEVGWSESRVSQVLTAARRFLAKAPRVLALGDQQDSNSKEITDGRS